MSGRPQVAVPAQPTRQGPHGILYDFNEGLRLTLPTGSWRLRLSDLDTGSLLFDGPHPGGGFASTKKYFVRFRIEIWLDGESVFDHVWDVREQAVLIRMEVGGLGDQIAWIGHAAAFAERHGCRVTCCLRADLIPLLQPTHPDLILLPVEAIDPSGFYATYKVFIFYNDHKLDWSPCDYRVVGLAQTASYVLGMPTMERRPPIAIDAGGPPMAQPYVCIATQASGQSKYWNHPHGWSQVIAMLTQAGFAVVCIDLAITNGKGLVWNHMPHGAIDQTGNRPLSERARWLRHAAFFVGLSSGLSWLAWAAGTPVMLISGFTHPFNEFHTPWRIINHHVCNSCSNDIRLQLDPSDFLFCPRLKGTDRMFECSRHIEPEQVMAGIRTIPAFAAQAKSSTMSS